jgi:hypothetical protein
VLGSVVVGARVVEAPCEPATAISPMTGSWRSSALGMRLWVHMEMGWSMKYSGRARVGSTRIRTRKEYCPNIMVI